MVEVSYGKQRGRPLLSCCTESRVSAAVFLRQRIGFVGIRSENSRWNRAYFLIRMPAYAVSWTHGMKKSDIWFAKHSILRGFRICWSLENENQRKEHSLSADVPMGQRCLWTGKSFYGRSSVKFRLEPYLSNPPIAPWSVMVVYLIQYLHYLKKSVCWGYKKRWTTKTDISGKIELSVLFSYFCIVTILFIIFLNSTKKSHLILPFSFPIWYNNK